MNLNYIFILNFRFFILVAEMEIAQYFKITDFGYFLYSFVGRHIPLSKKVGLMKKEIRIKTLSKKIRKSSSSYTFSLLDIFLTSPALLSAY